MDRTSFKARLGKAYATSTQLYNWHFTPSDLANQRQECNTAARKRLMESNAAGKDGEKAEDSEMRSVGLDPDEELNVVKRYIYLMKALFDKFTNPRLPDEVYGFAVTYLKRFYLTHSVMDFYPREIMLLSLYMACKASDFPIGLQAFISHIPRNQERYSYFILNSELFLLEALHYDLWVYTPYRPLTGLIVDLISYQKRVLQTQDNKAACDLVRNEAALIKELRREGADLINMWYQTDLCLTVHPSQFALAVLVELGRTRPQLDVEVFVRDELCGCDPLDKGKKSSGSGVSDGEQESEDDEDNATNSKPVLKTEPEVTPEQRWKQLSGRLDFIRETVSEFEFVLDLQPMSPEEIKLDQCRNPLYNLESEEYAEAKSHADSLLANFD
ncbi:unnamed protein product [Calicophoron daubneyi]|uniref:Cyclin C-terminal domain-containing protein n=1 Tax=Calicophoron daubneyi TaxID=300641 RepID=A0AAV2T018_CALDB